MYAVTGASGNTGRVVAEKLLADREKVAGWHLWYIRVPRPSPQIL